MNLRTGDILVWRSTNHYDILGENTIMLDGFHSGIVLIGDRFREFSACGPSPSHTYVTFLVDSLFPIEEVIGHVWHRPNGAALYHIRRITGKTISDQYAYEVFRDYLAMEKRHFTQSIYIAIASFFRVAGIAPSTGYENKRWNICSLLIGYCLDRFGLLDDDAIPNNLLPLDYYNLTFYQKEEYERVCIFDKKTNTYEWFFAGLLINLGQLEVEPVHCPVVDQMLAKYDYPRYVHHHIKKKADEYLIDRIDRRRLVDDES